MGIVDGFDEYADEVVHGFGRRLFQIGFLCAFLAVFMFIFTVFIIQTFDTFYVLSIIIPSIIAGIIFYWRFKKR